MVGRGDERELALVVVADQAFGKREERFGRRFDGAQRARAGSAWVGLLPSWSRSFPGPAGRAPSMATVREEHPERAGREQPPCHGAARRAAARRVRSDRQRAGIARFAARRRRTPGAPARIVHPARRRARRARRARAADRNRARALPGAGFRPPCASRRRAGIFGDVTDPTEGHLDAVRRRCGPRQPGSGRSGFVLDDPSGAPRAAGGEALGRATNNVAEYRALIAGSDGGALELGRDRARSRAWTPSWWCAR